MTTLILASSLTGLSAFVEQVSKVDNMVGENLVVSLEGVESREVSILDEEEDSLVCPIGEQMGVESKSLGDSESMLSIPLSCSTEARKETFSLHETVQTVYYRVVDPISYLEMWHVLASRWAQQLTMKRV